MRRAAAGFTLIEVILAIVIALGILVVLLSFYQQATHLRGQIIQETERIAAARLLMDRMTTELRGALPDWSLAPPFVGGSNSLEFIKADVPSFSSWSGAPLGRSTFPVTDLKRISYRLESTDGTNAAGVVRFEEPLVISRQLAPADTDLTNSVPGTLGFAPVLEEIRFLQFRYWSGTNWLDTWNESGCPEGVEVSLGSEPAVPGMDLAEYPGELFRRVIYLAASRSTAALGGRAAAAGGLEQEGGP